jgi:hypothetical protein
MPKLAPTDLLAVPAKSAPLPGKLIRVTPPLLEHPQPTAAGVMLAAATGPARPPKPVSPLWQTLKRCVLFWRTARGIVQVSVVGPPAVVPGQSTRLAVYLHPPEAAASVRTLARAFHPDAELIASGYLAVEVARTTMLEVQLGLMHAGVAQSRLNFVWRGQPHRLVFDFHVPWESPAGPAGGVVSVGRDQHHLGTVEFQLTILPRK